MFVREKHHSCITLVSAIHYFILRAILSWTAGFVLNKWASILPSLFHSFRRHIFFSFFTVFYPSLPFNNSPPPTPVSHYVSAQPKTPVSWWVKPRRYWSLFKTLITFMCVWKCSRVVVAVTAVTSHLFRVQLLAPTQQIYFLYLTKNLTTVFNESINFQ